MFSSARPIHGSRVMIGCDCDNNPIRVGDARDGSTDDPRGTGFFNNDNRDGSFTTVINPVTNQPVQVPTPNPINPIKTVKKGGNDDSTFLIFGGLGLLGILFSLKGR